MRKILLAAVVGISGFSPISVPAADVAPAEAPKAVPMDETAGPIPFRSLSAVESLRQTNIKWQDASQTALAKITPQDLKDHVTERLTALAPQVAKDLLTTPGENAVVTITTYTEAKDGEQVLTAVSYEGLGNALNKSFFPRVVADMPQSVRADTQPTNLVLDTPASGYLVYFLSKGDLKAGYIPHAVMKQSLGLAITKARRPAFEGGGVQIDPTRRQELADARARETAAQNQQLADERAQQAANNIPANNGGPNYYGNNGYVGNDGAYYNNFGWQPYVVSVSPRNGLFRGQRSDNRPANRDSAHQEHQAERPAVAHEQPSNPPVNHAVKADPTPAKPTPAPAQAPTPAKPPTPAGGGAKK